MKTSSLGLVMWTAVLATVASAAPPDAKRPPGAKGSELVAKVLVTQGKVEVVDSAHTAFAAEDRLPVALTDSLKVAPQAFVVLVITANQQAVRIDDDVELPVKDIAALRSGPAGRSLQDQVEQLLTVSENAKLHERLMGWMVAPVAASAPGAVGSAMQDRAPSGAGKAKKDSDSPSPAPRAQPPPPPPAAQALPMSPVAEAPRAPPAAPPRQRPQPIEAASKSEAREERKEASCEPPPADDELRRCLAAVGSRPSVKLRYLFDVDHQYRTVLERGLPLPACASRWVAAHARTCEPLVGQWQVLEVRVK